MALSPKDIYEKNFKRSFRGYDEKEVDEFLDRLIVEVQSLILERDELKSQLETVSAKETQKPAVANETAPKPTENYDALVAEKLVSAQK